MTPAQRGFSDALKASIDITEYVGQYTVLKPRNGAFWGHCPLPAHPGAETTPSFKIDPHKQLFFCFGCEGQNGKVMGGDVIRFVQEREGVDFKGALKILDEYVRANNVPVVKPRPKPIGELRALAKQASEEQKYRDEDDGSGEVSFWVVSTKTRNKVQIKCPVSDIPMAFEEIVANNPPNATKLQEFGIVSRMDNMWAGRYVLISPDTDWHKKENCKRSFPRHKEKLISDLKALPYCVAIIGTYSGGIAPIFIADTKGVNPADKPSQWMKNPEWIKVGLDKDENTQRRFLHSILWTNPDAVPYVPETAFAKV
jgi:hypothetical protein